MTNQEAIKRIKGHIAIHKYMESHAIHIVEALEMAIKALEEQDVPDTNVGDTISRQAAIDALRVMQTYKLGAGDDMLLIDQAGAQTELMMLPSAEPEIIRCKDCKHHWTHRCMDSMPTEICELDQTFYDANVDFCSLAERRTDG